MKLIKTIHRSSGHSARISIDETGRFDVGFFFLGKPLQGYGLNALSENDAVEYANAQLMEWQEQDD